jgi:hypothetical protein
MVFDLRHIGCGGERVGEFPDRDAQAQHGAHEAQDRNGPDHGVNNGVAGSDLIFVVFTLRLKDGGDVAHAADVVQVGKRAINAVEEDEIAGVIDQAAHSIQHRFGGGFVEHEFAVLRHGGHIQSPPLHPQFGNLHQRNHDTPKEEQCGRAGCVQVPRPDKHGANVLQGGMAAIQHPHEPDKSGRKGRRQNERESLIDTREAATLEDSPAVFDVFTLPT